MRTIGIVLILAGSALVLTAVVGTISPPPQPLIAVLAALPEMIARALIAVLDVLPNLIVCTLIGGMTALAGWVMLGFGAIARRLDRAARARISAR